MLSDRSQIDVHYSGATTQGKMARWCHTEIPHGWQQIGDVVRGDESGGMLLRNRQTGTLMCWDGKALTSLPQERTLRAAEQSIPDVMRRPVPVQVMQPWVNLAAPRSTGASHSTRRRYGR